MFLGIVFGAFGLLSFCLLGYQSASYLPTGEAFAKTTDGALHLFGHLIRMLGFGFLSMDLLRLHRTTTRAIEDDLNNLEELFSAQRTVWKTASILVVILLTYTAVVMSYMLYRVVADHNVFGA